MEITQRNIEELARQYSEWKGYQLNTAVKVGETENGGWIGELGIIGFHQAMNHVAHIEVSISGRSWEEQEAWLNEQFDIGRAFIFTEVFPELTWRTELFQIAILADTPKRQIVAVKVFTAQELIRKIRHEIDYDSATGRLGDDFGRFELLGLLR